MIVGVVAMQVMQPPVIDEVDMSAVLHAHVLLTRVTMGMVIGGHSRGQFLGGGIGGADIKRMLVDMAIMAMVQVAVMQIIDMPRMFERLMPAGLTVGMAIMSRMKNFMRESRNGKQGKRQRGAIQGSVHESALQMR